ncbi:MAG TPA: metalloregulator ArsR/SmtB family transcription factor [Phenylobacterium sp.]|jgi:DNA-binding transcriptional ArsR family regulator|uniref:ArsR/SmtB family transcription factor n=1 Tax=Phenylobacterium sp. TaxID=1871053 RepID=UPI002D57D932|nr:metalloregulator ArsR/SmtB family transcription factor [Phenylobacterium sp.]HZZ67865.1 metalloregulator ArsR/SmtB family transcription factor [Phenylobacterium sp.]
MSGLATPSQVDLAFHALGDPTRRAIVERLSEGPRSVSGLAEPLGVTITAIAQHLQVLEQSGLVRTRKTGRVRTCRMEASGFGILEGWIAERRSTLERQLDRLGDLLAEEDD